MDTFAFGLVFLFDPMSATLSFFDIRVGLFQSIHFNPFPPRAPDKHDPYVHITLVFNHNEVAEHKHPQAAA